MLKKFIRSTLAIVMAVTSFTAMPVSSYADPANPVAGPVPLKSWYTKAATNWETEALPLGNGYMGAMVFGGLAKEQILINEKTLWSGGPGANPNYDGGHKDTAEQKHTILQQARTQLQDVMTQYSAGKPAYKDPNGKVIARDYSVPDSIKNLINGSVSNGTIGLIGTKGNFGSYQELGSIWLQDMNSSIPVITRTYTAQDNTKSTTQKVDKLFDDNINTKFFADGNSGAPKYVIEWDYDKPMPTKSYSITTGDDSQPRDPKNWTISASNDGLTYTTIETVSGFELAGRKQTQTFDLDVPGSYKYFKITITSLYGTNQAIQMSELKMIIDESALPSNYKRELDLNNAVANVSYNQGGVEMKREYLVNYPDNVMAIRLSATGTGKIGQFVSVTSAQTIKTISSSEDTITMTGWPSDHNKANAATDFSNTLHFAMKIKVIPTGGTMVAENNGIQVENADSIIILMTAGTNYKQSMDDSFHYFTDVDPLIAVSSRLKAAADKGYDLLRQRHLNDYKNLFDRVNLNLMNVPFPNKPTDQLLAGYSRTNSPLEDRYLEQLYYQFGRYLLISSSREGSLPANLQGVWAAGISPPWNADYHANINLQMNYWPAEQANLSETHTPMLEYIKSLVPRGTLSAKNGYVTPAGDPVRGWTTHHENNVWGNTAPAISGAFFSPEDGAWLAQDIWEHYQFTMDKAFLQNNYDIMLQAALFWVDTLWTDTRDGTLVANPSFSPEHGPYSLGATEVQEVVWGIFEEVIKASDVLNIKSSELTEIITAQSKLAGPKIGLGGEFMEWKDETNLDLTGDGGHRHTNHLYGLHPGSQIVAGRSEQEDEFVEAMKVTLNTRGDLATGWSKAWKLNFWARLRDGDRAQKLVKELLYGSTLSNLFDTHSPFQIDGNFGATAGMTEMLLQSQGGAIELLPALPSKWSTGSVSGLKARGNVEVDMAWDKGNLSSAVLKTGTTGPITVKGANISTATVMKGNAIVNFNTVDVNTIVINAQQGETYVISDIQEVATAHNPYVIMDAVDADLLYGRITKSSTALQEASAEDYAMFKNVQFGSEGANKVFLQVGSKMNLPEDLGKIELRLDSPTGPAIASILADNTGELDIYKTLSASLPSTVTGTHDLYISFTRPINLNSLQFFTSKVNAPITGIKVLGSTLVGLRASGSTDVGYAAGVAFADGSTETGSSNVQWSLSGNYSGVKIDDNGKLSVKEGAGKQDIVVIATSTQDPQFTKQLQVRLIPGTIQSVTLRGIDRNGESAGSNSSGKMQFGNDWVENTIPNGWLKFNKFDLKDGLQNVAIGYASPSTNSNRKIETRIAEPNVGTVNEATKVATMNISAATGGWQNLKEVFTSEVGTATGIKDVYLLWPEGGLNFSYVTLTTLKANQVSTLYRDVTFNISPVDASIVVKDSEGYLYHLESDGKSFKLPKDGNYTYTVSKPGYFAQSGSFTANAALGVITVNLGIVIASDLKIIVPNGDTTIYSKNTVQLEVYNPNAHHIVNWQVMNAAGAVTSDATISANGLLTVKKNGTYRLSILSDVGISGELELTFVNIKTKLTVSGNGSVFGSMTTGSYAASNAFDGITTTFFEHDTASPYVGWDFGAGNKQIINFVRFFPRATFEARMVEGKIQGSNESETSGYVDLYTFASTPPAGWNEIALNNEVAYRYYRYASPQSGRANVSELEFYNFTDKIALSTLISDSKANHDTAVEGAGAGKYPIGSKAVLLSAINVAKGILENISSSQQSVDTAKTTLQAALTAFNLSVNIADKSVLTTLIGTSQAAHNAAIEGIGSGQYPVGSKATLLSAINAAKVVVDAPSSTQVNVDAAKATLQAALTAFNSSVISVNKSVLTTLIGTSQAAHDAAIEGTGNSQYPVGSKATLLSAINVAQAVVDAPSSSQANVEAAIVGLQEALAAFKLSVIGVTKTELNSLISDSQAAHDAAVEGAGDGQYSAESKAALLSAINVAKGINGNVSVTQADVNAAIVALREALATFRSSVIVVDKSGLATLVGPEAVYQQQQFDLTIGVSSLLSSFTTLNVVLNYDPSLLEFDTITNSNGSLSLADNVLSSLRNNFNVMGTAIKADKGQILIIMASEGNSNAISTIGDLLTVHAKTKAGIAAGITTVTLSDFNVSYVGSNTPVTGVSFSIQIKEVDKTELNAEIAAAQGKHDAATEGNIIGQYPSGSKAILQTGIDNAKAVRDNTATTQLEVANVLIALNAVLTTFNNSVHTDSGIVDKAALKAAITAAQSKYDAATEGNNIGQYPSGSKAILQTTIDRAKAVRDNTAATQLEVADALIALNAALTTFNNSVHTDSGPGIVDKAALSVAIVAAQSKHNAATEGTKIGKYPAEARAALQAAITSAKAVLNSSTATQAQANSATVTLNTALQTFLTKIVTLVPGQTSVSISDLSVISKYYGTTSTDANWSEIEAADLFNSGKIDIQVLAAVARMILDNWLLDN